jgi:hypothetical protein
VSYKLILMIGEVVYFYFYHLIYYSGSWNLGLGYMLICRTTDLDAYLPPQTLKWCCDKLSDNSFNLDKVQGFTTSLYGSRVHCQMYLTLWPLVRQHVLEGNQENLGLRPKVTSGYAESPRWDFSLREGDSCQPSCS